MYHLNIILNCRQLLNLSPFTLIFSNKTLFKILPSLDLRGIVVLGKHNHKLRFLLTSTSSTLDERFEIRRRIKTDYKIACGDIYAFFEDICCNDEILTSRTKLGECFTLCFKIEKFGHSVPFRC